METVHCSRAGATGKGFMIRINYTEIHMNTSTCLSRKTQFHLQNLQANLQIRNSETQLDVTCFISLLNAQHVSDVNTSILRSLRLMC